ncbi:MAG TPA: class I SAM-dependent methyltransferase [Solirubrobacteraceae bacterium]|nr:class I SAM-dependent methyltransferase [Solirubrobacteraceae bacterium]
MAGLASEEIERYALEHSTQQTPVMAELQRDALANLSAPQMLSGPVEGRLLELLVWSTQARNVLEIGTFAGYSALSMAAGLPPGGRVVSCEIDAHHAQFAQRHIDASPYGDRIELKLGPAIDTIAQLDGPFDLVFIDADKTGYAAYYEAVLPKLAPTGLIAVDNTLWSGRVLDAHTSDPSTRALIEFNELVVQDERVSCVMLTVRDGITLIRRR